MKKKLQALFLLTLILLLATSALNALNPDRTAAIEGVVVDEFDNPIPAATVALYDEAENNLITGTTTDMDGSFTIDIEEGSYTVVITFLSYSTFRETITLKEDDIYDLETIRLEQATTDLQELVVEGEASQLEMRFDRRSFNVGSDLTAAGGTALDVLDNVPSVETDLDGTVSLRGSENVRILINGRPSALLRGGTDALNALPADIIERVEVITNPSARYAAQGDAGILNIILKRNRAAGFNGNVAARTGYPDNHGISSNVNWLTNNANWFSNFSFNYRNRPASSERFQEFFSPDTTFSYDQTQERERARLSGNLRLGAEFFLSDNQTLTASTYARLRSSDNRSELRYTDYDEDGLTVSEIFRNDVEDDYTRDFEFSLDYDYKMENDRRLTADFRIDFSPEIENSDLREFSIIDDEMIARQRSENLENTTNIRFQIDYTHPVGDRFEFEAGARSTFRWVDNQYKVEELDGGEWNPLENFNDNFNYYQNINAVYGIASAQFEPFSFQVGLRAEHTLLDTELTLTGDGTRKNYAGLFPSLFATYEINDANSIQASFSRRLTRPRFRNILPFSNFRDSRNIRIGNPELNPVYTNSYELSYLYYWSSGSALASVYHRQSEGVIQNITTLGSDGVTTSQPVNLSDQDSWGVELSVSKNFFGRALRVNGSANYFFSDTNGEFQGQVFERTTSAAFGRLRLRWRIADGTNLQTSIRYSGPRNTTQGRRDGNYSFDSGFSQQLFDGRATLSLSVRDMFDSRDRLTIIEDPNFYSENRSRWSSRTFRLNFTYRFSQLSS